MFIKGENYELCNRITDGHTIPMKLIDGKQVKKVKSEFTPDDLLSLKQRPKTSWFVV